MPSQYQTLFAVTSQHMKAHRERTVQPEFVARVETRMRNGWILRLRNCCRDQQRFSAPLRSPLGWSGEFQASRSWPSLRTSCSSPTTKTRSHLPQVWRSSPPAPRTRCGVRCEAREARSRRRPSAFTQVIALSRLPRRFTPPPSRPYTGACSSGGGYPNRGGP